MKKHVVSLQRVLYIIGNSFEISITLKMFRKDADAFVVESCGKQYS